MLNKLQKRNSEGFTIIEVMIVLAIAALILLIVLLAVPALQRSSRNTQRKNDVSALAAAVANYISDNNGTVPNTISLSGNTATLSCAAGGSITTNCDSTDTNVETAKVGIFTTIDTVSGSSTTSAPDTNTVDYVPGYVCNSTNTAPGATNPRSAAFLYQIENGGTAANECTEQ